VTKQSIAQDSVVLQRHRTSVSFYRTDGVFGCYLVEYAHQVFIVNRDYRTDGMMGTVRRSKHIQKRRPCVSVSAV
jgi:hypothetical protein